MHVYEWRIVGLRNGYRLRARMTEWKKRAPFPRGATDSAAKCSGGAVAPTFFSPAQCTRYNIRTRVNLNVLRRDILFM